MSRTQFNLYREVPDFNVYINPRGEISPDMTDLHNFEKRSGKLYLKGNPVSSVDPKQGFEMFQNWILKNFYENSALLVWAFSHFFLASIN